MSDNNQWFDSAEWKIEHRGDGQSFLGIPYKTTSGKVDVGWIVCGLPRWKAEWIFDAVSRKQATTKEKVLKKGIEQT